MVGRMAATTLRADGRLKKPDAKRQLLRMVQSGVGIGDAVSELGYAYQTYEQWRKADFAWAQEVSRARRIHVVGAQVTDRLVKGERLAFPEFSRKYLRAEVFPHTQNVVDLLEERDPQWMHPSMTFVRGEQQLIIVNMPPEHAKTMSVTINYATHQTVMNPNIRGLVVSKTRDMSMKMLYAVKARLTEPAYVDLIDDYAPAGGFDGGGGKWTQDTIYLNPEIRDSGEKDPTWQALGIRGHIYGTRADLIIMDDPVDLSNAHEFNKQIEWIITEVLSRLSPNGTLIIVGTRLAPQDLYAEIQKPEMYPDEVSPWTYLSMPAVLEFADDPKDWVTLWPRTNQREVGRHDEVPDEDGLYPKWNGPRLSTKRGRMTPSLWARVYQQQQVAEDTTFKEQDIRGCINGNRLTGVIPKGMANCRPTGMDGLIVVAGLDPATTGHTSMVVVALDLMAAFKRRYVLDVFNKPNCAPDDIRNNIYRFTEKYGIVEWVVETNGFQGFLAHDREVNAFLNSRGAMVRPHHTGNNKQDPDFGVSAMARLFNGWQEGHNLIELPSTHRSEGTKALVEQLSVWMPKMRSKHQKTDTVMALWMAEMACLRRIDMSSNFTRSHGINPFLTRYDSSRRASFNIADIETYDRLVSQ